MSAEADLAIAGAGYVGLTSAACFCEMGHRVQLVEADPAKRAALCAGRCPICEPSLPELLQKHLGNRLQLTERLDVAARRVRALFVCVNAPPAENGVPDLGPLKHLLDDLNAQAFGAHSMDEHAPIVVLCGYLAPGTSRLVWEYLDRRLPVVANPEFLVPGAAVQSFFHPTRLVLGSPDEEAALAVAGIYHNLTAPLLLLNWEEAELVKYAHDTAQRMQSALAAEVAALCAIHHANTAEVLAALGMNR
ncbi:MAG: hypothetical protein ACM3XM_07690 [Mycobacterium leprae]